MRTVETKVYLFKELSDTAKQKAIEWYRNGQEFHWSSECIQALEKALEHFNVTLKDYSIDWDNINGCYTSIEFQQDDAFGDGIENLCGVRLWKYLQKNHSTYFCKYNKKYKPTLDGNCPFTGWCWDESFLDPIREFIKKPTKISFGELIEDCIHSLLKEGCNDWEYQQSDEVVSETIEANGYEFTEDGDRF